MKVAIAQSEVFMKTMVDFLKQGAVEGDTVESIIVDVFSELYSDEPGPQLQRFAYFMLNNMGIKDAIANTMLDQLHDSAQGNDDIYDVCDQLQKKLRRKVCLPFSGIDNPRLQA